MKNGVSLVVLMFLVVMTLVISTALSVGAQSPSKHIRDLSQSVLLNGSINGSGIAIATGESWNLYQGYSVHILGVDMAQSRVLIRLSHDNDVVLEEWTQVEDSFIYSKPIYSEKMSGSTNATGINKNDDNDNDSANNIVSLPNMTILSITVDSVYGGDTRDLVMLYPIYQYLDTEYETPALNSSFFPDGGTSNKTPLNDNDNTTSKESPAIGMFIVISIIVIVASCMKIRNY